MVNFDNSFQKFSWISLDNLDAASNTPGIPSG